MTPNDGTQRGRDAEALIADLVARWREAERHWQKMASGRERSYGGPLYEDGLAEAFGRCADIVTNEIAKKACGSADIGKALHWTETESEAANDVAAKRWERKDLRRWLKNARKRYNYWNEACRRTGAKAHERKELYAADIDRLQQLLGRPNV